MAVLMNMGDFDLTDIIHHEEIIRIRSSEGSRVVRLLAIRVVSWKGSFGNRLCSWLLD